MIAHISRSATIKGTVALLTLLLAACTASAQFGQQRRSMNLAASYAYSGGDNGFRLELAMDDFVIDGGFFDSDGYKGMGGGDVYGLELGVGPGAFMSEYEGAPFVLGVGAYRFSPDDPEFGDDDSIDFWLGTGDFDHEKKGAFFQYRYIFSGPIEGSQGIVGWAF
jgi:hypothetical protein